jgi:hypothetical protein
MRFFLGLLGLLAILAAGIIGYNWLVGNNSVKIESPQNGATLYTDSVRVQLSASDKTQATLVESGPEYQLVTYLDGQEAHRGKELAFDIPNVKAGSHELKVGIADHRQNMLDNIALQPGPVRFTVSPSASHVAANDSSISSFNNSQVKDNANQVVVVETPTPTPEPQPTPGPVAALPASGEGGGSRLLNSSAANLKVSAVNPGVRVNFDNPAPASQVAAPEPPMHSVFRSLIAFYVASFIVGLVFVGFGLRRRRRRRIIWERKS